MVGTLCIYLSFYKLLLCTRLYSRSICIGLRVGVACGRLHRSHQSVIIVCSRNSPFQIELLYKSVYYEASKDSSPSWNRYHSDN